MCTRDRYPAQAGTSLVEVMVAVTILTVVVWGTVAFLLNGRIAVERAAQRRAAAQVAAECLERARNAGYSGVSGGSSRVSLNGTTYTWTLTVTTATADPGDPNSVYKLLEVSVNWPTSGNNPVVLRTAIAP